MGLAHHCVYLSFHFHMILKIRQYPKVTVTAVAYPVRLSVLVGAHEPDRAENKLMVGGPGVKPEFAASDATVLFSYTTHPSGTRAGNPTRISSLGPKCHHTLDHASLTNVEGMQRIEL
jgi:hypothetical protein